MTDLYLLTDIDTETVGLVERGAVDVFENGQNFFMLKSQAKETNDMADSKFMNWLRTLAKNDGIELPDNLEAALSDEPTPEPTPTPEPVPAVVAPIAQSQDSQVVDLLKTQLATTTAQLEALNTRLQKNEQDLQKERELRAKDALEKEQGEFIRKAQNWDNLVVDPVAFGKALHAVKAAISPEFYQLFEGTIERGERLVKASNVWGEFGSTKIDENDGTPLAKAQKMATEKGIPLAEAILALPQADQMAMLAESRGVR